MPPAQQEIIHSYRHIYKHLLRAVQYSKPARFVARDRMRIEFRHGDSAKYDETKVTRTLQFLELAAKSTGLEHRIVKNLMHVWHEQWAFKSLLNTDQRELRKVAYDDLGHTIRMLEQTMSIYVGSSVLGPKRFDSDGPFVE